MEYTLLLQEQLVWSSKWFIFIVFLAISYVYLLKRFTQWRIYKKQVTLFFLSLLLLYITVGSPLTNISHLSFSLHMIQMSVLYFIIPPLFLLGIPDEMFETIKKFSTIKIPLSPKLPKFMLYTFALLFLIYHLPAILNILSEHTSLQTEYLSLLSFLSFGMWWPIVAPSPKQRLNKTEMKRYAKLSGLILMPACMLFIVTAFIDSGNNPFLNQITAHLCIPASSSFQLLPPPFNTKLDQVMAGIFMLGLHKFGLILTFKLGNKMFIPD